MKTTGSKGKPAAWKGRPLRVRIGGPLEYYVGITHREAEALREEVYLPCYNGDLCLVEQDLEEGIYLDVITRGDL